jgi:hypothetical protein
MGYWRQHELFDGTYDIHDLAHISMIIEVIEENKRRAQTAREQEQNRQ